MDISKLVIRAGEKFENKKPTEAQLSNYIAELGVADYSSVASLLVSVWAYLFPRNKDNSPKCIAKRPFSTHPCGEKLHAIEFNEQKREIVMVCAAGHTTIIRTSLPQRL